MMFWLQFLNTPATIPVALDSGIAAAAEEGAASHKCQLMKKVDALECILSGACIYS